VCVCVCVCVFLPTKVVCVCVCAFSLALVFVHFSFFRLFLRTSLVFEGEGITSNHFFVLLCDPESVVQIQLEEHCTFFGKKHCCEEVFWFNS